MLNSCLPAPPAARTEPRRRLIEGAAIGLAQKPYGSVTLGDVLKHARATHEEFAHEFGDLEQCLLLAYDEIATGLVQRVEASFAGGDTWPEKLRAGLQALLRILAGCPDLVGALAVRFPAAAPEARWRYRTMLAQFIPLVAEGREYGEREELPEGTDRQTIAGAEAIIREEIAAGRTERLPESLPDILYAMLVPYLGPTEAARERQAANDIAE